MKFKGFISRAFLVAGLVFLTTNAIESPKFNTAALAGEDLQFWRDSSSLSRAEISAILLASLDGSTPIDADQLADTLLVLCKKYRFDPAFVLAVIRAESGFRPTVVSSAGAVGLMQLMPGTAQEVSEDNGIPYRGITDLYEPHINLELGVTYLAFLRDEFHGKLPQVLAAYNFGPYAVKRMSSKGSFDNRLVKRYVRRIVDGAVQLRTAGRFYDV